MKQLFFILFFSLVVGNVYGQYKGEDSYYYDAHDVDKLLAIKAANPQANLNWTGNDYDKWIGCSWFYSVNDTLGYIGHLIV